MTAIKHVTSILASYCKEIWLFLENSKNFVSVPEIFFESPNFKSTLQTSTIQKDCIYITLSKHMSFLG
jgi:hypothetical protein